MIDGKYERNPGQDPKRSGYDEDYQRDVYDFFFQTEKGKKALEDTEPYFYALQGAISRTLRHVPDLEHRYFDERGTVQGKDRKVGYVVITGDKGMAGAYNHNVEKLAEDEMAVRDCDSYLFILGKWDASISHGGIWRSIPSFIIPCRIQRCTGPA